MGRLTKPLMLASLIAAFSATPAIAASGPSGCKSTDAAALRAYFHRAEFNVMDEMGVYLRDLSAYGNPSPVRSVSATAPATARTIESKDPPARPAAPRLDLTTLRAFFHSGAFDTGDGLVAYAGR